MPVFKCEIEGITVVLLGNFNPSIVQPAWLAKHGLIREKESEKADIKIIRPEICIFTVGDMNLLVQQDRFQIDTSKPELGAPLRDLALGIYHILEHTPITAVGINRNMHFKMPSENEWHAVGDHLAPKEIWEGLVDNPGMHGIIIDAQRPGSKGRLLVKVEPSKQTHPGVFVGTNEHLKKDDTPSLLDFLEKDWEEALRFARSTAESLLSRCLEPK